MNRPDWRIESGGSELLARVGPMWTRLRQHHAALNPLWSDELLAGGFEERRAGLLASAGAGLLVSLAIADERDVGYCVSTINHRREGEVASLFVSEDIRSHGIGTALLTTALDWLARERAESVFVDVLARNPAALEFYRRFHFAPRMTRLRLVPAGAR